MISSPSFPNNKPRIVSVEQPTGGYYVVGISVDHKRATAAVVPPFGSTLTSLGLLPANDLSLTPPTGGTAVDISGYVLSQVKSDDTGSNHVWLFEKLPGATTTGYQVTNEGQIATVTTQPVAPGTTVTPSATVVDAKVSPDGAGRSVKQVVTVPSVFPATAKSVSKPYVVPEKFLDGITTTETSEVSEGTISATPALGTDEISRSERQVTVQKKQVNVVTHPKPTLPVNRTGQQYDDLLGLTFATTESLTASGSKIGTPGWEVTAIGDGLDVARTVDTGTRKTALLGVYFATPDLIDINLPDELLGVNIIYSSDYGEGTSSDSPTLAGMQYAENRGTTFSSHVSKEHSASVDADVHIRMRRGYRGPAPSVNHLFFLDSANCDLDDVKTKIATKLGLTGASDVRDWPAFKEEVETIVIFSGRKQKRVSSGGTYFYTSGVYNQDTHLYEVEPATYTMRTTSDTSYSVGRNAKVLTIPDCIHPTLAVTSTNAGGTTGSEVSVAMNYYPDQLPGTKIELIEPGIYLRAMDVQPYATGVVRVMAKTVDLTPYSSRLQPECVYPPVVTSVGGGAWFTASTGQWESPSDAGTVTYAYQWFLLDSGAWSEIVGATTDTLVSDPGYSGKMIKVRVTATNSNGSSATLSLPLEV